MAGGARRGTPAAPPTEPGVGPSVVRDEGGALEGYHVIADTVGGVPSLRWKDNLFQAVFALLGGAGGALAGYLSASPTNPRAWFQIRPTPAALIGGVLGLIGAVFVSGLVLMVLGWVRGAKRLADRSRPRG